LLIPADQGQVAPEPASAPPGSFPKAAPPAAAPVLPKTPPQKAKP
jgi:hypothetical protein